MKCDDYRALLSSASDEPLSPEEESSLSAHLSECEDCRLYAESLQSLREELQSLPDVPPALHERVMSAVKQEAKVKKLRRFSRYGTLAACLLLIAGLGLFRNRGADTADTAVKSAAAVTEDMAVCEEECEEECAIADYAVDDGVLMMSAANANSWEPDCETLARDYLWERCGREFGSCTLEETDSLGEYEPIIEDYEPVAPYTLVKFEGISVLIDGDYTVFGVIE